MSGPLGPEGVSTGLETGEVCIVRGFTGQYEFSFLSKVLQTFEKPFAGRWPERQLDVFG